MCSHVVLEVACDFENLPTTTKFALVHVGFRVLRFVIHLVCVHQILVDISEGRFVEGTIEGAYEIRILIIDNFL